MGVVGVGVVGEEIMRGVTSEYQHGRVILCIYTQYIVSCILSIIQDNAACMLFSIKRSTLAQHA